MGWNTTVVIMNDALGSIAKDPNFAKNLVRAIQEAASSPSECPVDVSAGDRSGGFCRAAIVIESHHSSEEVLVRVGHNGGEVVHRDIKPVRNCRHCGEPARHSEGAHWYCDACFASLIPTTDHPTNDATPDIPDDTIEAAMRAHLTAIEVNDAVGEVRAMARVIAFVPALCREVAALRAQRPNDPKARCFHVEAGKHCTRYLEGSDGAREALAEWLREVHPLKPIGDVRDSIGFTACDALASLVEANKCNPGRGASDSTRTPRPPTYADGDRVRVGSWAQQNGTITGWRGDIGEWWVQLDDREKYPQWHAFAPGTVAPLAVVEQVFEKLAESLDDDIPGLGPKAKVVGRGLGKDRKISMRTLESLRDEVIEECAAAIEAERGLWKSETRRADLEFAAEIVRALAKGAKS